MITCPWCGTSYLSFQPNCKNCGGPLPVVAGLPVEAEEVRLPVPPPAPRPISKSYVWRLLATDGGAIAAFVFLLLGGIFFITGIALILFVITAFVGIPFVFLGMFFLVAGAVVGFWRYQLKERVVNILTWGEVTSGQIVDTQVNYSVQVNRRHPWIISYQFRLNGQTYNGKVSTLNTPGPHLQPGCPACVLYLPKTPDQNVLYPHP